MFALALIGTILSVGGTAYGIIAGEDAKRRQKNELARQQKIQDEAIKAAQTQEQVFQSLQNLNGYQMTKDLSEVAANESKNRLYIYIAAGVLALVAIFFFINRKKKWQVATAWITKSV